MINISLDLFTQALVHSHMRERERGVGFKYQAVKETGKIMTQHKS